MPNFKFLERKKKKLINKMYRKQYHEKIYFEMRSNQVHDLLHATYIYYPGFLCDAVLMWCMFIVNI